MHEEDLTHCRDSAQDRQLLVQLVYRPPCLAVGWHCLLGREGKDEGCEVSGVKDGMDERCTRLRVCYQLLGGPLQLVTRFEIDLFSMHVAFSIGDALEKLGHSHLRYFFK
jgi:hypothetical protein